MNRARLWSVFAVLGCFGLANSAVAEWRIGAELTTVNTDANLTAASTSNPANGAGTALRTADSADESAPGLGLFAQYHRGDWGLHFGYAFAGPDWETSVAAAQTPTGAIINFDGFRVSGKTDAVIDLLGIWRFGEFADGSRPFVMGGFSRAEISAKSFIDGLESHSSGASILASAATDSSASLDGYKLAFGVEKPAGDNRVVHLLGYWADYGDADLKFRQNAASVPTATRELKLDLEEWGVKIGVAHRF